MAFYTYRQNNSGGTFVFDPQAGISTVVIVEADTASEADTTALGIGLYFDGCDTGSDCRCCGDRWDAQVNSWGGTPESSEVPEWNGVPAAGWAPSRPYGTKWQKEGNAEIFVHYRQGHMVGYGL